MRIILIWGGLNQAAFESTRHIINNRRSPDRRDFALMHRRCAKLGVDKRRDF